MNKIKNKNSLLFSDQNKNVFCIEWNKYVH